MARVVVENYPHYVVQRGHNGQLVFAEAKDCQRYTDDLRELKEAFGVEVYAYYLMSNHVHLLLAPSESKAGLSQLMKTLAARTTRYRNELEVRTGTLWESRYKSSVVQSDSYLLACCRYIELNPVSARMVANAADYPWSSFTAHASATEEEHKWMDFDPCFCALGRTREEQSRHYVEFVRQAISKGEWNLINEVVQRGQLTGNDRFIDEMERIAGLLIEQRGRGRPSKTDIRVINKSVPIGSMPEIVQ